MRRLLAAVRPPLAVLVGSLALTGFAAALLDGAVDERDRARMDNAVQSTQDRIETRIAVYEAVLRAGADAFQVTGGLSAEQFRAFVDELDLPSRYAGVQGIGYSLRVPPGALDSVEAVGRAAHDGGFRVWPAGERGELHTILYLQPLDARNRAAIGYDMFSEPTRREAMSRARDSGEAALSGRVELVQEIDPEAVQAGFLIYAPVYRGTTTPASVEARREALLGFVYSPFRAGDLFRGIFGREAAPRVAFRVYDGPGVDDARLLFDSGWPEREPRRTRTSALTLGGRTWTLRVATLPAFEAASGRGLVPLVAAAGVALSLLLFLVTRSLERARDVARASEAARSRFFAAMSHEIRTPINAVLGYHDLLVEGVLGPLEGRQRDSLLRSQRAARHLREIVNDVLDLSKIHAGKAAVEIEEVALPRLLDDLLATLEPVAAERGCRLSVDAATCTAPLRTDPRRVRQVLLNLVSNATRFGAGAPVDIRCRMDDDEAVVEVTDRGPGIAPEYREAIFDEFTQLPGGHDGGTGLGLPISRQLAELLGGRLEVESTLGEGSTFRLVLPRREGRT